ncbi:MAG: hypothetical protein HKN07_03065, partial [Acidimicrobiia bacterium]|nr:hypothetical protein [Acidimicrobiia bacterium]
AEASGSADSGDAGASVVILDPMLTTENPIGAVQVLDVQVFDASGAVLSGVSVQLVAVDTTGTTTTLSAITDATGIAGFTAVTITGDTEYIAVVDGVSSNAIDITGLS